jgi:hypothetical protein
MVWGDPLMGSQEMSNAQPFPESAISGEAGAQDQFRCRVRAELMSLFDDPQIQHKFVVMLRNRIRSEPSLLL